MDKVWYIKIDDREEGPYSVEELKQDRRLTPDTLARKKHNPFWRPIRNIPELASLFEDEETDEQEEESGKSKIPPREELTLELHREPPYFIILIILLILLIFYMIYLSQ